MKAKDESAPHVVAILPARYGSTRFPGKPLVMIKGKSLIQRTYENVKKCNLLNEIIIATDDERIYTHAQSFGAKVVMTPVECPTGSDRLAHVLRHNKSLKQADVIVNVQGDEPCMDPQIITDVVEILLKDRKAVMSTAVTPIRSEEEAFNPSEVKCVLDKDQNVLYFSRTLIPGSLTLKFNRETLYYKHLGIYGYRPKFLLKYAKMAMTPLQKAEDLEQLKVLENGYKIKAAIASSLIYGVNTPEDLKKVELLIC